ncbi:MAG: ATP-grasp domain-containing protein [Gammaproteobacteria bacterium]
MRIWFNKTFSTIGAVFRQLKAGYPNGEVTIVCTHTHRTATAFLAADEAYLEPADLQGLDYIAWSLDFCREHRIGLFWPGKEAALASKNRELFEAAGVRLMAAADHETLTLLNNKAQFYAHLPKDVALTMDFIAVNDAEAFDRAVAALSARHSRLCVKPAVSVYGLGFRVLDRERDSIVHLLKGVEYQIPLRELLDGMRRTPHFDTLLVMEHLGGPEWSVDCAARHGELLCAVQRKKSPLAGHGQSIDNHPDIAGMTERLIRHYRLNGLINIQYKEGVAGPRLLEINPRPSGGFGMACLAGANLARIALEGFKGDLPAIPPLRYGLKISEINTPVVLQDDTCVA